VGDFGLSRVLETNSTHVSTNSYGTVAYMPAEMLKDGRMTKAVDVYSFAIIMVELFAGDMVYRGMSSSQARARARAADPADNGRPCMGMSEAVCGALPAGHASR